MFPKGRPMKRQSLLIFVLLFATTSLARTRNWKEAKIEVSSETDVSSKLFGEKNTMHYTIETEDMIYFVEYTFKPSQHSDGHPPNISVNAVTKIAVEGHHAYVQDVAGKELKMHITKKLGK
jgi:hypothetical protein